MGPTDFYPLAFFMINLTHRQILHREYLNSPIWKGKRIEALMHYGCVCNRCGNHGTDVHHKTYERWGGTEEIDDLEILCRECHQAHHVAERCSTPRKRRKTSNSINQRALFRVLTCTQKRIIRNEFNLASDVELYVQLTSTSEMTPIKERAARMLGKNKCHVSKPHPLTKWGVITRKITGIR